MPPKKCRIATMERRSSIVELCVLDMWQIFNEREDITLVEIQLRMTVIVCNMISEVFYSR